MPTSSSCLAGFNVYKVFRIVPGTLSTERMEIAYLADITITGIVIIIMLYLSLSIFLHFGQFHYFFFFFLALLLELTKIKRINIFL